MHHIAINARDGIPRDAYVYHYSFNRSHLIVVVSVLFTTQQRLQYHAAIKSLASMKPFQHSRRNIRNLELYSQHQEGTTIRRKLDFTRGSSQVLA